MIEQGSESDNVISIIAHLEAHPHAHHLRSERLRRRGRPDDPHRRHPSRESTEPRKILTGGLRPVGEGEVLVTFGAAQVARDARRTRYSK